MNFSFLPMNEADGRTILNWKYEEPYGTYSMSPDAVGVIDELLDTRSPYYAVRDSADELIGFFCFGTAAEVGGSQAPRLIGSDRCLSVGLGMRPDLTSKGMGLWFVKAGLDFAQREFNPVSFRLFVLAWNTRAIRVYERAGFRRRGTLSQHSSSGESQDFVRMYRPASK